MSNRFQEVQAELRASPCTWLVTGAAGFIGSNLVEALLKLDQRVVGLDSFATGHERNLDEVQILVTPDQWSRFRFQKGDICRLDDCRAACVGADYVLHQAALGSVPRSLLDPLRSHGSNVDGFLNMAVAARDAKVRRFVYASSSSVYGDHSALPKTEQIIGNPLSPYAATKAINEIYARVFAQCYGLPALGLRYFNVFGPRQDPHGAYAAVIPRWFLAALNKEQIVINGNGQTSRDFCYIDNVIQANLLAATLTAMDVYVCNVAFGERTTLSELADMIHSIVEKDCPGNLRSQIVFREERSGDVRHSLADISYSQQVLGYAPRHSLRDGIEATYAWYKKLQAKLKR